MLGYSGYVNISDGNKSVKISDPAEITIKTKAGQITKVYTNIVDFKTPYSNYHGQFVPCIFGHKVMQGRKVVEEQRYGKAGKGFFKDKDTFIPYTDNTWTSPNGEIRQRTTLYGHSGICRTLYKRGSLKGQRFIYSNGFTAYQFSRKDQNCVVKYPNGKVALEFTTDKPIIKTLEQFDDVRKGLPYFTTMNMRKVDNFNFNEYDRRGRLKNKYEVKNRQQNGVCIKDYQEYFYLNGLQVPKKLYEMKPEQIDPRVILRLDNAQVRSMFLKKVGLDRIVKSCKGKLIHKDGEMELYDFPIWHDKRETSDIDKYLRILKVVCPSTHQNYFLRIPAHERYNTCENARQGTFNKFEDKEHIKFALET